MTFLSSERERKTAEKAIRTRKRIAFILADIILIVGEREDCCILCHLFLESKEEKWARAETGTV